ncbi:DUF2254 domain-containing protein [Microvirga arabica]|uniref:DUF2254 domain-containing protein n=1 Tax=Microvirga arabica TaxID=1128671 RepID=UPI00193A6872|nr:DUF2254 domain-containing protein [Microvirga arabica]MBM1171523.1 DUF2254 domain-containing protein [Microvirga arabica]
MERLRTHWEFLRTSFWFVPSLMAAGAVGLVALTITIERSMTAVGPDTPWFLYVGDTADARAVLSTILSSMITMATLVFSITMVVLTLAASQFGPRLIRSFMANPQTQVVLGTFVMTIVYCLLVFPVVGYRESSGKLPFVSVSIALALTVLSTGLLVLFLHSLARSIVSETVIERVGLELDELLDELAPLDAAGPNEVPTEQLLPADFDRRAAFFGSRQPGYVEAIQFERLLATAEQADLLIVLYFRAGHYVVPGSREFAVYPGERLNKKLVAEIQDAILTGIYRTPVQDPDFSLRHLDEIADRALSAAVNDPYTAVAVIDRLSASLCKLMGRALPEGVFRGKDGAVRLACTQPTYAGLIAAGFNQIRQNGAGMPIIVLHLLEAVERIAEHVRLPEQQEALAEQARVIVEAARSRIRDEFDRQKIEERYTTVERTLDRTAMGRSRRTGSVSSTAPAP